MESEYKGTVPVCRTRRHLISVPVLGSQSLTVYLRVTLVKEAE